MPSVFLIGFMAAGKTAVGRELAALLDRPFVDLDEQIARDAGTSVATIFADRGESAFRALEAEALKAVIAESQRHPLVVATGGGAAAQPENLEAMLGAGLTVELGAPLEDLLARALGDGGERPLLAGAVEDIAALLKARQPLYRRAHASLDTSADSPAQVAARVAQLEQQAASLGERLGGSTLCAVPDASYPIITDVGCLDAIGELMTRFAETSSKVAILTDDNVAPLYLASAAESLRAAGFDTVTEVVSAGEATKNPGELARLAEALVSAGLDRRSVIVALGGGVVGDLAGFVAATLFRGVRVVQVPTTLVAMVDSSIGGKTGVNLSSGKNLLGAFWQPQLVAIDPRLLKSLPAREFRAGLGELFKTALLEGRSLWEPVVEYASRPEASEELARSVIRRCAAYKSWIVSRDAREKTGERALLNLGHTVGHAIERAAGYGEVLHGEAVALGLIAAARVTRSLGLADVDLESTLVDALSEAGLDTNLDAWLRPNVLHHIGVDKKRTGRDLDFVVVRDVGSPEIARVKVTDVAKFLLGPGGL